MSYPYVRSAVLTLGLVSITALAGCGSSAGRQAPSVRTTTSAAASTTAATRTVRHRRRRPHPQPAPGSLPQTHVLPSSDSARVHRQLAGLWRGIRAGSTGPALAAFFPERAYAQVKAIANPHADYVGRLVAEYTLDIAAAHALLGSDPLRARLVRVEVPGAYAHWVPPGACFNRVGYYEVPNSRVVYSQSGQLRSFGIASMISWRGLWYVVHLGAVVRSGSGGVLDAPSAGAGTPTPSSTC